MDELFKWLLALASLFLVYLFLFTSSNDPVPEALAHHWTHDCRLLETNIDKGFSLLRKIDFSVVMLLKMSARLIMTER
ncbi:hypothetical protein BANRA_05336 [Klebsiella pneumoniae]|nr:hypothetical protein BANRA_05161 [Klebsiella pneumoniae]VDA77248.1 hypothetical protein BANRA_05336 [Klebsiella pneumoniae]